MPGVPQTEEEATAWVKTFHDVSDSLDIEKYVACFAEDGVLQFGNYPDARGRAEITTTLGPAFQALEMMKHSVRYGNLVGDRLYEICTIRYRVKGDTVEDEIEIPGAGVFFLVTEGEEKGLIKRFEVFINNQPVVDRIAAVAAKKWTGNVN